MLCRFFFMSVLCVSVAYVLMPEQSRFPVVCIVLHLHLTGKEQNYSECVWFIGTEAFQSMPEAQLNLKHQSRWYNKN